jgi:hypothetical protein
MSAMAYFLLQKILVFFSQTHVLLDREGIHHDIVLQFAEPKAYH